MKETMLTAVAEKRISEFAVYLRESEKSAATVSKYLHDIRTFVAYLKANGQRQLTKEAVLRYKEYLREQFAVTSGNSMLAALNCYLRFCGLHALCVKQFRVQRQTFCSEEKELHRAEYLRLIAAAERRHNLRLALLIQTVCGTGIRVSELRYITVESVQKGEACVNCKGKRRKIWLVKELRQRLLRYAREQGIQSGAIFVNRYGKPLSRQSVWREMKSLCKDAHVAPAKVFPHNLRHLFARAFYKVEKDLAKLADLLGHASINTTRIYIATTGVEHRRMLENMRLII